MPPLTKYSTLTAGVKISDEVVNTKIQGSYAIGILADGLSLAKVLSQFVVVTSLESYIDENNEIATYTKYTPTLNGVEVKVFLVSSTAITAKFPFAGSLIGNIPDQEKRLIQLMEEQGNYKYKIIKL